MTDSRKAIQPLAALGVVVRETRIQKHLTQQRAARGAGISRKQWALLEQGHNISAVFIQKVATFLELSVIPLGEGLHATTETGGGVDVAALFSLADELVSFATRFADRLRGFAMEAVLPQSERGHDAEAIAAFIARTKDLGPDDSRRLTHAIHDLAADVTVRERPTVRQANRASKRRKREG
jgi:transcriptional regulator with XRE-family HTH domain